jgi:CheY-like chemotaxis protein
VADETAGSREWIASSGIAAPRRSAGTAFEIVIMNLMMSGPDDFQLARAIKADADIAGVKLVLLPSLSQRGHADEARHAGIAAYLTKPVKQSQLYDCLVTIMAETHTQTSAHHPLSMVTRHSLEESGPRASQKLILLAEDNVVNQKVALRQLQSWAISLLMSSPTGERRSGR